MKGRIDVKKKRHEAIIRLIEENCLSTQTDLLEMLKKEGFDVLVCPWEVNTGITALAQTAKEENLFGMLETTWHHVWNNRHYFSFFYLSGDAAWNGGKPRVDEKFARQGLVLIPHIRHVLNDMGKPSYELNGTSEIQITKSVNN